MPLKEKLPNQVFHLVFTVVEEILGKNGLNSLLNYTKLQKFIGNYPPNDMELEQSFDDLTSIMTGLLEILGNHGSKTVTFQIGKRTFEIIRDQFPSLLNIEGIEPQERTPDRLFDEFVRIQGIMFEAAKAVFGDIYTYYECEEGYAVELSPCYWCIGLKTDKPICNAGNGVSFAIAKWITGQDLNGEETHCIAKGDKMCRHLIHRPKE